MLHVACCIPCCMLLRVVESCSIFSCTTANTDTRTPNIVGPTMLGVVSSVCTSFLLMSLATELRLGATCCVLLKVVLSFRAPLPTRTQELQTLLVQQCWELLRPFALAFFWCRWLLNYAWERLLEAWYLLIILCIYMLRHSKFFCK